MDHPVVMNLYTRNNDNNNNNSFFLHFSNDSDAPIVLPPMVLHLKTSKKNLYIFEIHSYVILNYMNLFF